MVERHSFGDCYHQLSESFIFESYQYHLWSNKRRNVPIITVIDFNLYDCAHCSPSTTDTGCAKVDPR